MSPSITEKIQQALREQAEQQKNQQETLKKAARERNEQLQRDSERKRREEQEKAAQQLQYEREKEKQRELKRKKTSEIFNESGVLTYLKEIDKNFLFELRKHNLLIDLDKSTATLVWGNKYKIRDNTIVEEQEGGFLGFLNSLQGDWQDVVKDYNCINVAVHIDNGSVSISGDSKHQFLLTKDEWKDNPEIIVDKLTECYLNPQRVHSVMDHIRPPRSSDVSSSSSSNTECCHN